MAPMLTTKQAAAILNLHPNTVSKMAREGILPAKKLGPRAWRYDPKTIENFDTSQIDK